MNTMTPLDELPPQLGAPKLDETTAALITAACVAVALADDPGAKIFAPVRMVPNLDVPDPEKEQSRRECYLDQLHADLEADPSPKEPVRISLFPHGGPRIVFHLDSLKKRKKRTPSERERRRLLGIQLADFLTAGGL
jgi:hypothetical protein